MQGTKQERAAGLFGLAMVLMVFVFEFGVHAGKQAIFKEEQAHALKCKNRNTPPARAPRNRTAKHPRQVVASYQEEPNTHYNPEPKKMQNTNLVKLVEIAKEEFETLKDMFFIRSFESRYAPVITVKFHCTLLFMKYVFRV